MLTQLLTGHGGIRAYLYRFKLADSPSCVCDGATAETVDHIIRYCPRFVSLRHDCEQGLGVSLEECDLREIMGNRKSRDTFFKFGVNLMKVVGRANGARI